MNEDLDVLVVGAGYAGLATALSAARHGARVLVVEHRPGPSTLPRATGIDLRTMEIFRSWGLKDALRDEAVPVDDLTAAADTLVAPPHAVRRAWGYPPPEEIAAVSPALPLISPQDAVEPILERAVREHGGEIRFGTRLAGLHQRPSGVTVMLDTGATARARFLVGADGARSTVRAALGIGVRRLGTWARAVQVIFGPDPAPLLGDRPHNTTRVTAPQQATLIPVGRGRWAYTALRFDGGRPDLVSDWTPVLRAATGLPDLHPEVVDVARITLAAAVADRYRSGSAFLVGDAAHRTTPLGALGLNVAVQDGHELGWKLAWSARGLAGEALLASHDAERAPVGLAAAERSLGRGPRVGGLARSLGDTRRSAVIAAPDPDAPPWRTDPDARPGERAPHVWVRRGGRSRSTLDLFDGRLTLLTGSGGDRWSPATVRDVPLQVLAAGREGREPELAAAYRLAPGSAVLVRPDGRIAWRHDGPAAAPAHALTAAVDTALGRVPATAAGVG